jgi:hypothetical protein
MAGINIDFTIANQKGTPAFYSDIFANRPTFGYPGRVFISTDTQAIYEDTGSAWTLLANAGGGSTPTLDQVTTAGNTSTLGILVQGLTIGRGGSNINTNTAIGSSALTSNTTGTGNVALGYNALLSNTIGTNNISIGRASFQGNLSGSSNTIIGDGSAGGITSGSTNICIGASSGAGLVAGSYNTIIGSYGGADTSNYIVLADGQGNARMYSNGSGLIGINQAVGTPSAQLDIHSAQTHAFSLNGTGTANAYMSLARAGTNQWRIGNTYNAGANTFDIYNFGTTSTALSFNKTTNKGTFIADAIVNTLTIGLGNSSIVDNTAIGYNALASYTSGGSCTAIGYTSMQATTTGANNVAVGQYTLQANIIGNSNTAVGHAALYLAKGDNNVAVGQQALVALTTGSDNVCIGSGSAPLLTTAIGNVIVGDYSLSSVTTGSNNTIIGTSAYGGNTTTTQGVCVGALSLASTTGSRNIGLGYQAGRYISTGTTNNTATINSVYIGYDVRASASGNQNEIVISGYNGTAGAVGLGSNTTSIGNSSTTTSALYGNILLRSGMGTAPATATSTGVLGTIIVTAGAIYVCSATNTWVRAVLTTF